MFEQIHGRERIICVLAAGSPEESIPPILKTRMVPDANGVLREMPAEPLAADLRPEAKTKRKAELLRLLCQFEEINIAQSVAVGDGANDLPMLNLAGLGIAFHAKPKVKATARQSISTIGLDGILYFLGLKDSRIEQ